MRIKMRVQLRARKCYIWSSRDHDLFTGLVLSAFIGLKRVLSNLGSERSQSSWADLAGPDYKHAPAQRLQFHLRAGIPRSVTLELCLPEGSSR